jgi:hypothetical protein
MTHRTSSAALKTYFAALFVVVLLGITASAPAFAQPRSEAETQYDLAKPNYARGGYFFEMTGLWAGELADNAFGSDGRDMLQSGGFHMRVGARHNRWFASDLMGRYIHNFDVAVGTFLVWGMNANERIYFSRSRFQPFVSGGVGFVQLRPTSDGADGGFDPKFVAVFGAGLEMYVTESFALVLEGNYNVVVGGAVGGDFVTAGLGIQFF